MIVVDTKPSRTPSRIQNRYGSASIPGRASPNASRGAPAIRETQYDRPCGCRANDRPASARKATPTVIPKLRSWPTVRARCRMSIMQISVECEPGTPVAPILEGRLLVLHEQAVLQDECVDPRAHEADVGVEGTLDDRLTADVEAGVDDEAHARSLL